MVGPRWDGSTDAVACASLPSTDGLVRARQAGSDYRPHMIRKNDFWKMCLIVAMPAVFLGGLFVGIGLLEVNRAALPDARLLGGAFAAVGALLFGAGLIACSIVAAGSVRGFDDRAA